MEEIKRVASDIDLTERNTFGRVDNVFNTELAKPKDISDVLKTGKVLSDETMPRYYDRFTSYYNNSINYYSTTTNSFSFYRVPDLICIGDNASNKPQINLNVEITISLIIKLMNLYIAEDNDEALEEIIENYLSLTSVADVILDNGKLIVYSNIYVTNNNINYMSGHLNYIYEFDNPYYASTNSTYLEYDDHAIDLYPKLVEKFKFGDVYKYRKEPDDLSLYIGNNAEYIHDLKRWCAILDAIGIHNVLERRSIYEYKQNDIRNKEEFSIDIDHYDESYNALDNIKEVTYKSHIPYLSYYGLLNRHCHDSDILSSRIEGMMEHSVQSGGYSEFPGIIIYENEVKLVYADFMRPTRYIDNGLHILQHVNPVYETIEYDLNTMQASTYENQHRRRSYPQSDLREGILVVKYLPRKEEEENGRREEVLIS